MTSLTQVRFRRFISILVSFAIAALISLPALTIRPDLSGELYYVGLIGVFVLLSARALHHWIIGPMIFSHASVQAPGIRRALDRLVPKTNSVFRMSPRSTNTRIQVEQCLWNGWTEIHRERQFESVNSMQLYVRDSNARSQPFIGPEFTGDDLLVIDGDEHAQALSMRHPDRYTERARDEANQGRRSLWSRRLLYCGLSTAAVAACGYGLTLWRTQPFAGTVLVFTTDQILLACGLLGTVALVAAYSYATRDTRRHWWHSVKRGSRYVRYRLVREAHEDRYFVQAYAASEWRTKTHLNGLDMLSVEKALEHDVRELRRIVAANQAAADARAARERLIAPFKVEDTRSEALLHDRQNALMQSAPAIIEMTFEEPMNGSFDQSPMSPAASVNAHEEQYPTSSKVLSVQFGRDQSARSSAGAAVIQPAS